MSDNTDNHGYETPSQGTENWHEPLNENFEALDIDVEVRDVAENRPSYQPTDGAKFLELDTGVVYVGDGEQWTPALAMAYYDDDGELVCGELSGCVETESNDGDANQAPTTFGENARSVHQGAIVFGDSTRRSVWSRSADEIRSQMPMHAPRFTTGGVTMAGGGVNVSGQVTAGAVSATSVSAASLDAAGLSVDTESFSVTIDSEDDPALDIKEDGIVADRPVYAPDFIETNSSAEAMKTGIEPVDPEAVLAKVESLPVSTWRYREGEGTRHMGPMAEAFAEAFGLGGNDASIATVDADGVAFAAIQGLKIENDALRTELADVEARLDTLDRETDDLRERLSKLEADGRIETNAQSECDD